MDIDKFKLTDKDLEDIERNEDPSGLYVTDFSFIDDYKEEVKVLLQTQVNKVLSMLEPMELEALGDEECWKAGFGENIGAQLAYQAREQGSPPVMQYYISATGNQISQATIKKNQSKGQLYRVKEGK